MPSAPSSPRPSDAPVLTVKGAREHNLKGVDLTIPRDALVTFTGVSGSGKSSLAFHTIYQEGQRRFLESLSSYARQFLGKMEKPKVDHVDGLSPTVSIDQKTTSHSARSTVGTLTEVLDFARLLWARLGVPTCPTCGARIVSWAPDRIVDAILATHAGKAVSVLAPVVRERKGEYRKELAEWRQKGFVRARIDGVVKRLDEPITLQRYAYHTIELVVDRLEAVPAERSRLAEAVEQAIALGEGLVNVLVGDTLEPFSTLRACPEGHGALPELEPRTFSFNSPLGACTRCEGLGTTSAFRAELLVRDPAKSLLEGALHGFTKDGKIVFSHFTLAHLELVLRRYGGDTTTPWKKLTKAQQHVVLHGSGDRAFEFTWKTGGERFTTEGKEKKPFPGLLPHFEKVYGPATARALDKLRAETACPECQGTRLGPVGRSVRFADRTLPEAMALPVSDALGFFRTVGLTGNQAAIGKEPLREILQRLEFLAEVGLGYLALDRRADTLSGGESQRIRLAAQVGAGLRGILYVLDEPSIGLHPVDQERLLGTLEALRDRGNSVLVVEHDRDTMLRSDWLVDVGPGAGHHGGEIVASAPPAEVARHATSATGAYLRGEARITVTAQRRSAAKGSLVVRGARHHNLKDVTVAIPLGRLVAVTGISGSGKSTLVHHILEKALRRELHQAEDVPGDHDEIVGIDQLDKVIEIDQSPIGRTPRSNPATYTGVWDHVRDLYAALPEAKLREYAKGRFSFNVAGGRCEACEGAGVKTLEMHFLAAVEVPCEECGGARFSSETLEIRFKGKSIRDVLDLTIEEAREFFAAFPKIERGLATLCEVGLDYVTLGQTSTTLSGGEAQRMKLATELQRVATGRTIYLLDEPTTGLHFADIEKLLACLHRLVDAGNTVLVIEHNLDVVQSADWVIELGPEGGAGGGRIVAEGTPEQIAKKKDSPTGKALAALARPATVEELTEAAALAPRAPAPTTIAIRGATTNNLKNIDVDLPLGKLTVVTGVSGSGKSSLAFDTLFREGQRRFLESLSTYARRFLGRMDRAPVERIDGLGPAIAIDQDNTGRSPRSTVATTTEIHDYLRLLWARIGRPFCPDHGIELTHWSPSKIARTLLEELPDESGYVLAPVTVPAGLKGKKRLQEFHEGLRTRWKEQGFVRALVDGKVVRLEDPFPAQFEELFLLVDRVPFAERGRVADSVEQAAREGAGIVVVRPASGADRRWSTLRSCPECSFTFPLDPHPRLFSFNHHLGACATCGGLGEVVACDPDLLVNHPDLPVFEGGVVHAGAWCTFLVKTDGYWAAVAEAVGKRHGFDSTAPFHDLDKRARQILLWGLPADELVEVVFKSEKAGSQKTYRLNVAWKGLCGQVQEWYHKQDGEETRERYGAVMRVKPCQDCEGERLGRAQRHVVVGTLTLPELTRMTVTEAMARLAALKLPRDEATIAAEALKEIRGRLHFLESVGLGYLTLDRSAATLSGGEAQRIRLATQLGNRLVGVLYVLDEPTVGLHPRDTSQLLKTLLDLRDLGNTVVAVEHDPQVMHAADHVLDMGPGAGQHGGLVVASGTPAEVARGRGLTAQLLRGELGAVRPPERRTSRGHVAIRGAKEHNLKGLDLDIPLGVLCAVTGVSGSGKSSLVMDVLLPQLEGNRARLSGITRAVPIVVDQSPIGTTPASNPATYTGVLDPIRELFAQLPAAKIKGFKAGRFSFNTRGGRCEACEGKGSLCIEMHFLADVWIECEVCKGRRYNSETLTVDYRGKTIADVLRMEARVALDLFGNHPKIARPLRLLCDVGLGYLELGRSATTLSGGEAQRLKLVAQLSRAPREHVIYLLDEPTTGLHADDTNKLVAVLQRLVARGDSVIVIEHNLDVIACADVVIELGPEAGTGGGHLVVVGTPEEVAQHPTSWTGRYLAPHLVQRATAAKQVAEAP